MKNTNVSVALYPRVSTQEQAINGHSIDEQIDRMTKYCDAMNWHVYKVYKDAGFSGANTDRPALKRMIKDIEDGKIDKVLVYKLDRLSRSQRDTLYLIEDIFLANDCDFVSMNENFDTSTPFGRAMIGILAVFSQLEREQIKERMMMGKYARAKSGKYKGGYKDPIGYDYIDGNLVVNEFEKSQIVQIFNDYASGKSAYAICKDLNDKGMTHKFGEWKSRTLRRTLDNKLYAGYIQHRGEWFKGDHEALISDELFEQVQRQKEKRKNDYIKTNKHAGHPTSYLGGLVKCSHCHANYTKTPIRKNDHEKYLYYMCNSRSKKTKQGIKNPECKNKTWRMDALDKIVFDEIRKLSLDPLHHCETPSHDDQRPTIRKEIDRIERQIEKTMDLYALDSIPLDVISDRINNLNDQKTRLESELERLDKADSERMTHQEASSIIASFSDILDSGDFDNIRSCITALIDFIEIDNEDIIIHWNFT